MPQRNVPIALYPTSLSAHTWSNWILNVSKSEVVSCTRWWNAKGFSLRLQGWPLVHREQSSVL